MRPHHVHYQLDHGFIQNWLVAGPQTIPVEIDQYHGENIKQQIFQKYYDPASGITINPIERGPLTKGLFQIGDYTGSWNYHSCREDHQIDHSGFYSTPHFLRSWAYAQIASIVAQDVWLVLTTHGPSDVWLNQQHIHRHEHILEQQPGSVHINILLAEGTNQILVRFENVAIYQCQNAMALQVCRSTGGPENINLEPYPTNAGIHVCIPTLIKPITRRNNFERAAAATYITQDVFEADDQIRLWWPDDLEQPSAATVRLLTEAGQIYAQADVEGTAGDQLFLSFPIQIPEGSYRILIMPRPDEYYDANIRITREINLWNLGKNRYSAVPYGTFTERCQEALSNAAGRENLFAEIAKMALNKWETIETKVILQTLLNATPLELLGILGILYRYGEHAKFPKELIQPIEECILNFQYKLEDTSSIRLVSSEGQRILSHACEILAGQRYPKRKFSHNDKTGQWHRKNGEQLALDWLQQCSTTGFADWDSSSTFTEELIALSHLVDLAETEQVWEIASVVMDKLFFTIAINSYQGVLGSTHGRTNAAYVKGGLLEPTSGISRLMWGTGIFNHHTAGPVSLACIEKYELPSIISDIAVFKPEEMWSRERHKGSAERFVNKVTYKTPDTMLCSAQDYHPGEKGCQEHIWQATLGAAATVFVTHPACSSENDARQPNFWAGNAILPRVAQWKDTLIAIYHLPEDDWMGFTHAYFPTYAFDEYTLRNGWAFTRKGNGYLALTAAQGLELIQHGHYAFRELRSYGLQNAWLCQLGRAAVDGDFTTFQEKVLATQVTFEDQSVQCTSLRSEALSFGWQGPFLLNGQEQPISGFMHYENPYTQTNYPCTMMEIQYGEDLMRLDFEGTAG
jgi:hypothetical protein